MPDETIAYKQGGLGFTTAGKLVTDTADSAATHRVQGLLVSADGEVLVETSGSAGAHRVNGLEVDTDGKVLVDNTGAVAGYVNGLPVNSSGRVVVEDAAVSTWVGGLPRTAAGKLAVALNGAGFDPLTLSPLVWLKADAVTAADADPLSQWDDSSGNARHFTQASAGLRPTYRTNQLNGKPGVLTDGTDDYLSFEPGAAFITTSSLSIFLVARRVAAVNGARALSLAAAASEDYNVADGAAVFEEGGSAEIQRVYRGGVERAAFASHLGDGVASLLVARWDGTNNYLRRNGVAATNVADGSGAFATRRFALGRQCMPAGVVGAAWHGYFFEMLVFPSFVTGADLTAVEGYLNGKWAVY